MELGKGEALVSFLEGNGTPSMVERCMIRPPSAGWDRSRRPSAPPSSPRARSRGNTTPRSTASSAYEKLGKRVAREAAPAGQVRQESGGGITGWIGGIFGTNRKRGETLTTGQAIARRSRAP